MHIRFFRNKKTGRSFVHNAQQMAGISGNCACFFAGSCAAAPLILYPLPRGNALSVGVPDRAQFGRVVGGLLHPRCRITARQHDLSALLCHRCRLPQQCLVHKLMPAGRAGLVQHQQVKGGIQRGAQRRRIVLPSARSASPIAAVVLPLPSPQYRCSMAPASL